MAVQLKKSQFHQIRDYWSRESQVELTEKKYDQRHAARLLLQHNGNLPVFDDAGLPLCGYQLRQPTYQKGLDISYF